MGGPFYPPGTSLVGFLPVYASQYKTAEIDSRYCRLPSRKHVQGWFGQTPSNFIFAVKFPGEIAHKEVLVDCEKETEEFLNVMELLGKKPGPGSVELLSKQWKETRQTKDRCTCNCETVPAYKCFPCAEGIA